MQCGCMQCEAWLLATPLQPDRLVTSVNIKSQATMSHETAFHAACNVSLG